jgi:cytochrome P450
MAHRKIGPELTVQDEVTIPGVRHADLTGTVGHYLTEYGRVLPHDPARAAAMVAGWIRGDWRGLFAELRAEAPVFATPAFVLVTKFADVHEVLARERVFTVRPTQPQLDAALGSGFMLSRDATPLNWRERGLMQTMLPPGDVPAVRGLVASCAEELLDGAMESGHLDVITDLFRPIALRVCEEYFGYRGVEAATLSRWVRDVIKDCYANPVADPALHTAAVESGAALMGHLRAALGDRRGCPARDDVFGRLAALPLPAACEFDDERIAVNVAGLPLGFVESAPAAMALATRQLVQRPAVLAEAVGLAHAADPAPFDAYVWEALRLDTFFRLMPPRLCEQDYLLAAGTPRATPVAAGSVVLPALASAMYDEDELPSPEEFRPGRPDYHHLHFGTGHHHDCLGVHLARAIIPEAVRRLLRRGVAPVADADIVFDAIFPDSYPLALNQAGARR